MPSTAHPRTFPSLLASVALVAAGTATLGTPATARPEVPSAVAAASTNAVDTTDRAAVAAAYRTRWEPTLDVPSGWTGSVDTCTIGTNSTAHTTAVLDAVNFARGMAGLDAVALDVEGSKDALAAALVMKANNRLTHSVDPSLACYSERGRAGAESSNLAIGVATAGRVVDLYMDDPGPSNIFVGHRRWVLAATTATMGVGSTDRTNALKTVRTRTNPSATQPEYVPWPTAGFFPAPLEPNGRWSLSTSRPVDLTVATVTMTGPAGAVPLTVHPTGSGYGPDTLVWDLATPVDTRGKDVTYRVTVSGMRAMPSGGQVGATLPAHSYEVTLFTPTTPSPTTPRPDVPTVPANPGRPAAKPALTSKSRPVLKGRARVGRTMRVTVPKVRPASAKVKLRYTWRAGKKVIARTSTPRLVLPKRAAGKRVRVTVRATAPGHRAWTWTTKRSAKVKRR